MEDTERQKVVPFSIYQGLGAGATNGSEACAVVLFHGMTGTPSEMSDLADSLHAKGYAVFAPCLTGHGSTIENLRTVSHQVWLREVDALFQHISQSRYSRIIVGGLSFGSLLALYLAKRYPDIVSSVVALSVPIEFRRKKRELLLQLLSFLPEGILDHLPTVEKVRSGSSPFARPRIAYTQHSVGAAARLVKIRRLVQAGMSQIHCPILLLQDPHDHHLSPRVPFLFRKSCKTSIQFRWIPAGHHELTLGHSYQEVIEEIVSFVEDGSP